MREKGDGYTDSPELKAPGRLATYRLAHWPIERGNNCNNYWNHGGKNGER